MWVTTVCSAEKCRALWSVFQSQQRCFLRQESKLGALLPMFEHAPVTEDDRVNVTPHDFLLQAAELHPRMQCLSPATAEQMLLLWAYLSPDASPAYSTHLSKLYPNTATAVTMRVATIHT